MLLFFVWIVSFLFFHFSPLSRFSAAQSEIDFSFLSLCIYLFVLALFTYSFCLINVSLFVVNISIDYLFLLVTDWIYNQNNGLSMMICRGKLCNIRATYARFVESNVKDFASLSGLSRDTIILFSLRI